MPFYQNPQSISENAKSSPLVRLGLGRGNYWFTFVSDPLTIVCFILWDVFVLRSNAAASALSFGAGILCWTFIEYSFHRWVYHEGQTPAHTGHNIHHQSPETLIAMPWFVVTAVFSASWYFLGYLLQIRFVMSAVAGLLSGFVLYGAFHHILHRFNFKNRRYRQLRAHHFVHHQNPNANFGVTSPVWDYVFGTVYKKERRRYRARPA
jgi:dihydroceramide fatty acyl 2-hydroxylase